MDALAEASDDISGFHTVVTFDDDFSGFDTVVTFDDDIHVYVDPETDGLEGALGQQPGSPRTCSRRTARWSTCGPSLP